VTLDRRLKYNFHPGQRRAWKSTKRIVAIIAGGRSGKTSFAPIWLHREMQRQGPGDYLIAAPSYPLIDKAAGPEIENLFGRLLDYGQLKRSPMQFVFSEGGAARLWGKKPERQARILFGHADDPESLEAMSAKAAWLDEAGQGAFKLGSWEAVQQRLSIDRGRVLITSKPYNLGWMKQKIYDPWVAASRDHPEIDVIRFDSTENPAFPPEEMERARKALPAWKFDMQFRGLFTRPAGLIYDCFDESRHVVPRFPIPDEWRERFLGLDFGGVNTVALFFVRDPATKVLHLYQTYKAGSRTAKEHADAIRRIEPKPFTACVGGSHSEGQWRAEFAAAGLSVWEPPIKEVEVGIDRVYGFHRENKVKVFADLAGYLDEKLSYSREVDDAGQPLERIDNPNAYHHMDAERYILAYLHERSAPFPVPTIIPSPDVRESIYQRARGAGYGGHGQRHGLFGRR
jgi:hypothetical protein